MADPIGIASGIAGLVTLAWQIVNLSHSYISDVKSADRSRRRFEQELLALTSILLQAEEVSQDAESLGLVAHRPAALSANVVSESHVQLLELRSELQKHSSKLIWPFREKEMRKHVDALQRISAIFTAFLTSNVLSHVIRDLSEDHSACITYFFCDFSSQKQQSTTAILRNILLQAAEQADSSMLAALNEKRQSVGRNFAVENLAQAFLSAALTQKDIFLVLDAPDELESPKEVVSLLQSFVKAGCKVCVTSRDIPEIRGPLSTDKQVNIKSASREDLATYIKARFAESDFCDALAAIDDIVDAVILKADGIFLLAKLFLDQLLELSTLRKIRKTVKSLPESVKEAFQTSLERIDAQPKDRRGLAHRLIRWITHSHRRLKANEIMHAFAVEEDEMGDDIDEENCPPLTMLLKVCVGLVAENPKDGTIGMVHTSAYEFFRSHYSTEYTSIQMDIAKTSLLYLSSREMMAGPCESLEELDNRLRKLPFLPYAARHWGRHIETANFEEQLSSLIMSLVDDEALRSSSFQILQYRHELKSRSVAEASFQLTPRNQQPLHIAAYWDLEKTALALLAHGDDPSAADSQKWTPLHWASSNSNMAVTKVLIDGGADLNARDSQGWTPLFWTAFNGDAGVLRQLLESGANHLVRDISGWTTLKYAISRRHFNIVQPLIEHYKSCLAQAKQDSENLNNELSFEQEREYVQASIEIAADVKRAGVPSLLSKPDMALEDYDKLWSLGHFDRTLNNIWRLADKAERVNGAASYLKHYSWQPSPSADNWKSRLLHVAIKAAQPLVLKLLIELGADVNFPVGCRTPLHTAAFRKDPQFAEILLQHGADTSLRNHLGHTALHSAVINGFYDTAAMLLEWNADPDAKTESKPSDRWDDWSDDEELPEEKGVQRTPLMLACGLKFSEEDAKDQSPASRMVELLLASHADVNLKDHGGKTCLFYAIRSRRLEIVKQMIDAGAQLQAKDRRGRNALHYAVRYSNLEVVKMVVDAGGDATIDKQGANAFHHFADRDRNELKTEEIEAMIDLLTEKYGPGAMSADWTAPPGQQMRTRPNETTYTSIEYVFTPLALALKAADWRTFALLEARGATFNTTYPLDHLLFLAVFELQPRVTRFLLDRGAWLSPETYSIGYIFDSDRLSESPDDLALILNELPRLKVDINAEDEYYKRTMLLSIVQRVDSEQITQSFLDAGADPFKTDTVGLDAFLHAVINGRSKTLHCLLQYADSHKRDGHWTAHLSPPASTDMSEDFERVCSALECHGSLNEVKGDLPLLHHFVQRNDLDKVQRLLAHGADTEIPDKRGWRPLHFAFDRASRDIDVARTLIEAGGADAHAATATWREGYTKPSGLYAGDRWTGRPLHLAAMHGSVAGVELLLAQQGVDVNASTGVEVDSNNSGHGPTALRIALDTGHFYARSGQELDDDRLRIAQMLIDRGAHVEGAADHLVDDDILRFEKYPVLWKTLRSKAT
ncbi:putative ankyrin repeat protein [Lasiodiplodia theobromae]|uniref:Putative ankyrin repeat protein n=1 Tax=Lasiodiplodia theobromae TaxID=45133 RepID=A0A5N5DF78_9PEZI|nr:putative ankyrin repeat protein [Lasiodiplodia theobromae]